jgi:thymidylate synthase
MKQYQDLLQRIIDEGCEKESGRPNMPHVWGIEDGEIKMDLRDGFPLLTTKKMAWKMVVHELLWFLRGETNIKYLVDNNVHIWDKDAYRWYQKWWDDNKSELEYLQVEKISSIEQFIEKIKNGEVKEYQWRVGSQGNKKYKLGDLGKVYGYQWRQQNGVDQIMDIIMGLKTNPYSRYHILDGWNKSDFNDMALPPCHLLYQFIVRPLSKKERNTWYIDHAPIHSNRFDPDYYFEDEFLDKENVPKFYLNLNMYQRSCDTFLGVPFNIASMSLLLMIIAKICNMIPKQSKWSGGDVHLYLDHIPVAKEQISRTPKKLPQMIIKKDLNTLEDILALTINDFELQNYESDDKLFGELHTGYKK